MKRLIFALPVLATLIFASAAHATPLGSAITYQGQLVLNGTPVNGAADLRFQVFDAPAGGNSIAGPTDRLNHAVSDGLFTVNDLDFGLSPFSGSERYLEISARVPAGGGVWLTLTPRQRIAPAPYAIFSMLPWQTIGNDIFYAGSRVGIGTNSPQYRLHVESPTPRAIYGICTNPTGNTTGVYGRSESDGGEGVTGYASAATGTTSGVYGQSDSSTGRGVFGLGTSTTGANYGVSGEARGPFGAGVFGRATSNNNAATADGVRGESATVFGAGVFGMSTSANGTAYGVRGSVTSPNGWAGHFSGRGYFSGNVGVGSISLLDGPLARLHVSQDSIGLSSSALQGEDLVVEDTDGRIGIFSTPDGVGGSGITLGQTDATFGTLIDKWSIVRETTGGGDGLRFTFGSALNAFSNPTRFYIDDAGNVGIGSQTPSRRLSVQGDGYFTSDLGVGTTSPDVRLHVAGGSDAELNGGGYLQCGLSSNLNVVMDNNEIMARNNGAAANLTLNNEGGDVIIAPQGNTRVRVLEITGADVAEKFPTSEASEPGTVMEIDPDNAGKLRVARGAYSKRVAGVVSGAGNLPVGAVLGNLPASQDGPPIALSGRVWVRCDASSAAIEPGDLLTTADFAGHAMKADDATRSHGAVIGKAMTALPRGEQGLVLVLVNLQ